VEALYSKQRLLSTYLYKTDLQIRLAMRG
jgi:hypothetical protein